MDVTGDELAGVVDLFGALSREELEQALVELAFKQGEDRDPADFEPDIAAALESYHLVAVDAKAPAEQWLFPGPVAFPDLIEGATDLPHIMDIDQRTIDRERLGQAAKAQFQRDTAQAVADGDSERAEYLLDVSYELEVWAPVDVTDARERLDNAFA